MEVSVEKEDLVENAEKGSIERKNKKRRKDECRNGK
jgi:hypothetical protein